MRNIPYAQDGYSQGNDSVVRISSLEELFYKSPRELLKANEQQTLQGLADELSRFVPRNQDKVRGFTPYGINESLYRLLKGEFRKAGKLRDVLLGLMDFFPGAFLASEFLYLEKLTQQLQQFNPQMAPIMIPPFLYLPSPEPFIILLSFCAVPGDLQERNVQVTRQQDAIIQSAQENINISAFILRSLFEDEGIRITGGTLVIAEDTFVLAPLGFQWRRPAQIHKWKEGDGFKMLYQESRQREEPEWRPFGSSMYERTTGAEFFMNYMTPGLSKNNLVTLLRVEANMLQTGDLPARRQERSQSQISRGSTASWRSEEPSYTNEMSSPPERKRAELNQVIRGRNPSQPPTRGGEPWQSSSHERVQRSSREASAARNSTGRRFGFEGQEQEQEQDQEQEQAPQERKMFLPEPGFFGDAEASAQPAGGRGRLGGRIAGTGQGLRFTDADQRRQETASPMKTVPDAGMFGASGKSKDPSRNGLGGRFGEKTESTFLRAENRGGLVESDRKNSVVTNIRADGVSRRGEFFGTDDAERITKAEPGFLGSTKPARDSSIDSQLGKGFRLLGNQKSPNSKSALPDPGLFGNTRPSQNNSFDTGLTNKNAGRGFLTAGTNNERTEEPRQNKAGGFFSAAGISRLEGGSTAMRGNGLLGEGLRNASQGGFLRGDGGNSQPQKKVGGFGIKPVLQQNPTPPIPTTSKSDFRLQPQPVANTRRNEGSWGLGGQTVTGGRGDLW